MATHGGAADSYYNEQQPNMNPEPKYQQPPPAYGQNYQQNPNMPPLPMAGGDGKQSFDQAFKLEKPKYNDLWAGILVRMPTFSSHILRMMRSN